MRRRLAVAAVERESDADPFSVVAGQFETV
jgi:hypothetical protein